MLTGEFHSFKRIFMHEKQQHLLKCIINMKGHTLKDSFAFSRFQCAPIHSSVDVQRYHVFLQAHQRIRALLCFFKAYPLINSDILWYVGTLSPYSRRKFQIRYYSGCSIVKKHSDHLLRYAGADIGREYDFVLKFSGLRVGSGLKSTNQPKKL